MDSKEEQVFIEQDFVWHCDYGYGHITAYVAPEHPCECSFLCGRKAVTLDGLRKARYRPWNLNECMEMIGKTFRDTDGMGCLATRMRRNGDVMMELYIDGHEWVSVNELAESASVWHGWRWRYVDKASLAIGFAVCAVKEHLQEDRVTWVK